MNEPFFFKLSLQNCLLCAFQATCWRRLLRASNTSIGVQALSGNTSDASLSSSRQRLFVMKLSTKSAGNNDSGLRAGAVCSNNASGSNNISSNNTSSKLRGFNGASRSWSLCNLNGALFFPNYLEAV